MMTSPPVSPPLSSSSDRPAARKGRDHSWANKVLLLLLSSLVTLALLGWAALYENVLRDWRGVQREYAARLPAEARATFKAQLRQIVVPALKSTDRCITCHLGMAPGEQAIPGHPLFAAHPAIPHDPAEMGCVVCHGGQGLATDTADAHGTVPHWPEPMLPRTSTQAGCGSCHTHLTVPNLATLRQGQAVLERWDCLACHALDGRGGTIRPGAAAGLAGPDLSLVGARGYRGDWYEAHLTAHAAATDGPWRASFSAIPAQELAVLTTFLESRVGAPKLVEGKALFHSLGCRGCHKVGGVGGDDGPDLTAAGQRDPGQTSFAAVPGEPTLANWFAEHFRNPSAVVPGSQMPAMGLSEGKSTPSFCSPFPCAAVPSPRRTGRAIASAPSASANASLPPTGRRCTAPFAPPVTGVRERGCVTRG